MAQKAGQLWVIEGGNGSGKATQAKNLVERLKASGRNAHYWSFPTYQDPVWGKLIKDYLGDNSKSTHDVDPKYASLLYAADRGKASEKIRPLLEKGDYIICDRYVQSNMAFQSALVKGEQNKKRFLDWLEQTEYGYFGVPRESGVIYLFLPPEISRRRIEERVKEAEAKGETLGDKVKKVDIHEQDFAYLKTVEQEYLRLAEEKRWSIINCVEGGKELSREEIAEKIWQVVTART